MGRCNRFSEGFLMYVLCDINAAYVAFSQLFNPQFDIHSTPLGVLSSNQGNVVARNQALKNLNIKMGEPAFKVKDLIYKNGGHLWGSNFQLFGDLSARFHFEVSEFVNDSFAYSVDEAFGKLNPLFVKDMNKHCHRLRAALKKNLGLSCGVGVSTTKTLAKLASHCAKQQKWIDKTGGVVVLDTQHKIEWALSRTEIGDIWGVGTKTKEKLNALGIYTGLELMQFDVNIAKQQFSVVLSRTIQELNSINAVDLKDVNETRERICVSQSMGKAVLHVDELKQALTTHVTNAAYKLRGFKCFASIITVFIATDSFRPEHPQYSKSQHITLPFHCADTAVLVKYALYVLDSLYKEGYKYKKAGVILSGIVEHSNAQQLSLFEPSNELKIDKKTQVSDEINKRFGKSAIGLCSAGFKHEWKPKDDLAPKSYTTQLSDLPTAYAK